MEKRMNRRISIGLVACILLSMVFQVSSSEAQTGTSENTAYVSRYVNGVEIVNYKTLKTYNDTSFGGKYDEEEEEMDAASYDAAPFNAFRWFYQAAFGGGVTGVSVSSIGEELDPGDDDTEFNVDSIDHLDGHFIGKIKVSDIPVLKRLAESGTAHFMVKIGILNSSSSRNSQVWVYTDKQSRSGDVLNEHGGTAYLGWANSPQKWTDVSYGSDSDDKYNVNSGWLSFQPDDYIVIESETNGASTEVNYIRLYFADIDQPTITDYTFKSNGTERKNTKINQQELFLKKGQNLELTYNFSEAVMGGAAPPILNNLNSHYVFTNPAGTGLPASGENQGLKLSLTPSELADYTKSLSYVYTASDFHHTGNLPISDGGELEDHNLNPKSLWEKIDAAEYHDAAGNPLQMTGFTKASATSNSFLLTKTVNPFDYASGQGYRVIIDAVPPKYNPNANGIQPDIVTGSTLNKGDVIDFKVQLTEDAIVKNDPNWTVGDLYLLFNNGMKAMYVEGENTSVWTFRAKVTESDLDVSLLKAIALTHEKKSDHSDTGVIQDYAGNLLMDAANTSKSANSDPSKIVANTKIDWAKLSIDNTVPEIKYVYENEGATDAVYKQIGKITIDANDPAITTPSLDPDESGVVRPSRGIYRPLNMTGSTPSNSPGVGLVYYQWSQSADNPLAGKENDQFAAVKRYSLTGLQPWEGLYPAELTNVNLLAVNNKTNLLKPPQEAFMPENSGNWYLHTWTADMTWDTARELMQVDKMKNFKVSNAAVYNGWISEYKAQHAGSSDTDAQIYADGKALEAVGDYKNLSLWKPADFKHDDSNWVYNKATLLLDNKAPSVTAHISGGNNTAEVKVSVLAVDEQSGIDANKLEFQWVKAAADQNTQEIKWERVTGSPGSWTVTTKNNVLEEGEYVLHLRAQDNAGNKTETRMEEHAVVNYSVDIEASFSPLANESFVRSHDIAFTFNSRSVTVGEAVYAFSTSAAVPDDSAFKAFDLPVPDLTAEPVESSVTSSVYTVLKDTSLNGIQYLHIRIKEQGEEKVFYFNQAYKFDNQAPIVSFSQTAVGYPKPSHSVSVAATELFSPQGMSTQYQWLPSAASPPDKSSVNWQLVPEDGRVSIDNSLLAPGESADFTLYIYVTDGAGNGAITHTGAFKLVREDNTPIEVLKSDLIYLDGNDVDGFYAIARVELRNVAKDGYEYTISSDDGTSWHPWLPYTNFVKVDVPSGQAEQLKLKVQFKSGTGTLSDIVSIDTRGYEASSDEPIYGLATQDTLRPVAGAASLTIHVKPGTKVVPAPIGENLTLPIRTKGNTFEIGENGVYTFDLTDVTDATRHDKLVVVVKNVDTTAPTGTIEKSIIGPTTANVRVRLTTSEDVRITNNEGRSSYTFMDNGSFTFEFEDEAGNPGSASVVVDNIDRAQPKVHIDKSYGYGSQGKTFKTIKNAQNQVVLAQGVTLNVVKDSVENKAFTIVRAPKQTTLYENGVAAFTIADHLGNTTVVEEAITHIVTKLPDPEQIEYAFVDEQGNLLTPDTWKTINGKTYAKGKMRVTLRGHVEAPNQVFRGTVPVPQGSGYANLISNSDGQYDYAMTYGTNGEVNVALTDLLGNINISHIKVEGLDNTAPTIQLNNTFTAIVQNKANFNPIVDLGGYTVSDNVSEARNLKVTVDGLDLTKLGKQTVVYTVSDEVGNSSTVKQQVVVLASDGLLIIGNDQVVSSASSESILFDRNDLTLSISGYNVMNVDGSSMVNERGTYDILYHSGLYREGQMKYIAQKITMDQLVNNKFKVIFPETGWYTLIVRTQEREREFATFFIGKINK